MPLKSSVDATTRSHSSSSSRRDPQLDPGRGVQAEQIVELDASSGSTATAEIQKRSSGSNVAPGSP